VTDTSAEIRTRYARELLRQTPFRRLEMACSMFASAKALAMAGIRHRGEAASLEDERRALLIRFYGADLSPEGRASVAARRRAA
jgi:arginase family enzyme